MPTFVFKGRNRLNEIVVGERVADNREALRQILRREQVTLTSVKEKGREIGIAAGSMSRDSGPAAGQQVLPADTAPGATGR
jgi:type II secretory pathway component PulF